MPGAVESDPLTITTVSVRPTCSSTAAFKARVQSSARPNCVLLCAALAYRFVRHWRRMRPKPSVCARVSVRVLLVYQCPDYAHMTQ